MSLSDGFHQKCSGAALAVMAVVSGDGGGVGVLIFWVVHYVTTACASHYVTTVCAS